MTLPQVRNEVLFELNIAVPCVHDLHCHRCAGSRGEHFLGTLDFVRYKQILVDMAKVGVPESWLTKLGVLKAAGAVGLLVGIRIPLAGTAAAIGLILFFVAAIITHLRARDYSLGSFGLAIIFLLVAVSALGGGPTCPGTDGVGAGGGVAGAGRPRARC